MADIAKCNDALCPSKEYCYRFTAPASEYWQSYGMFNREGDADNCEMFWNNGKFKNEITKEFYQEDLIELYYKLTNKQL